jgi:hypothetical protein
MRSSLQEMNERVRLDGLDAMGDAILHVPATGKKKVNAHPIAAGGEAVERPVEAHDQSLSEMLAEAAQAEAEATAADAEAAAAAEAQVVAETKAAATARVLKVASAAVSALANGSKPSESTRTTANEGADEHRHAGKGAATGKRRTGAAEVQAPTALSADGGSFTKATSCSESSSDVGPPAEGTVGVVETEVPAAAVSTRPKKPDIFGMNDGGRCTAFALKVLCDFSSSEAAIAALDYQREKLEKSLKRADQKHDAFLGTKGSTWSAEIVKMTVEAKGYTFVKKTVPQLVEEGRFKSGCMVDGLFLVNGIANDELHVHHDKKPRKSYFPKDGAHDTPRKNAPNWQHSAAIRNGKIYDEANPPLSSRWLWLGDDGKSVPGKKGFFDRVEKIYLIAKR